MGSCDRLVLEALAAGVSLGNGGGWSAAFAPGRLNLLGAHVDHSGGAVLPVGLRQGTLVLARRASAPGLRLLSLERGLVRVGRVEGREGWTGYLLGVIRMLEARHGLGCPEGLDLVVHGDLPIGVGLSSSASLTVAATMALLGLAGRELPPEEVALVAYRAEHDYKGVACGILDPFASALAREGHALFLRCARREWEHVPFPAGAVEIVLCDTGVPRELAGSAFNDRVAECGEAFRLLAERLPGREALASYTPEEVEGARAWLPEGPWLRARHVAGETRRVERGRALLGACDLAAFGRLLGESHASSRDLYRSTTPELDTLAEAAWACPVCLGARLSGGGFGGAIFALIRPGGFEALAGAVNRAYAARFGKAPALSRVEPGGGASRVPLPG